ncbi:ABC transporter permease [Solibacillus sp.]|uniref:ABC transporter permease n=1 Tax=Solibacillus sp. TaxID=1909654 RepID=UPI0033153157
MLRLIQADLYRLTRTTSIYVTLIIFIAFFVLSIITESIGTLGVDNEQVNVAMQALDWNFLTAIQSFSVTASILIYCFIIFYVHIFSSEFSNRTYKNILMSGTSRTTYLFSKLSMLFLTIIFSTIFIYIINAIVSLIYYGKPATLPEDFWFSNLQFILGLTLCIMVYYIVASFLQILFNSSIAAIVFIVLAPVATQILQVIQGWDWLKYVDYLSLTQAFGMGLLKGTDLVPYVLVNGCIVIIIIIFNLALLKTKEF